MNSPNKIKIVPNTQYNFLTVIEESGKKHSSVLWKCKCICSNIVYVKASYLHRGITKSCGCKTYGQNSHLYKGYKELSHSYWTTLTSSAKKRNLEFSISMEYAWNLFELQNKRCALTGELLVFTKECRYLTQQTASLDRIDSNKGYIEGNVQWVHKMINRIKSDIPNDDFILWCKKVYEYRMDL